MAEALGKIPHGDTSWVFVGSSGRDRLRKKDTKADTLFHRYMQEVFDVAAPVALAERADVADIQGKIAVKAAEELNKKNTAWQRFREHKNLKRFIMEQDEEWRGREVPHRLRRMLVFSLVGAGSFGLNMATDWGSERLFFGGDKLHIPLVKNPIELNNGTGNRAALHRGWEMLTDYLSGKLLDYGAKVSTNKQNIGFVTPLSATLAQVGNTVLSLWRLTSQPGMDDKTKNKIRAINSLINPGMIEGGFRAAGAIPWVGVPFEWLYATANRELLKQDGTFPFVFSLAYSMLLEKEMNQGKGHSSPVETLKARTKYHSGSEGGRRRI